MAEYRSVEGELGAVDTLTELTSFGGETTGPVKVPADKRRLVELWVSVALQVDTDTDRVGAELRLSGKGMALGEQDFTLAAGYHEGTGAQALSFPAQIYPVDLVVTPNENITVQVMATGDTVARGHIGITLVFA